MAAGGNSSEISLGPGRLYFGDVATADPISASAALPSANWNPIGYTEEGTEVSTEITSEAIEVAEEFDPVAYYNTARRTSITFNMVQATVDRLALAMGAGATRTKTAVAFEFPDPQASVDVKFVWDFKDDPTDTDNRRWVFRKCRPSGTIAIASRKAPAKRGLPITFDCATPAGFSSPVKVFPSNQGEV
jgi:hypothetical protein